MTRRSTTLCLLAALGGTMLAVMAVVAPYGGNLRQLAPGFGQSAPTQQALPLALELVSFLPVNAVRDASIDYTVCVQAALDASAGRTLHLAPYPVKVSKRPGTKICLTARKPMRIEGSPGSALVETSGASMILFCENIAGLRLSGFTLRGNGAAGVGQAHGILQVTGGSDIVIDGVNAECSDADGIVIANASDVRVVNCRVSRCSKAGIYLSNCTRASVTGNLVSDMIGHTVPDGRICGAAMQLSGNRGLVCSSNVLDTGIGIGILCNANENQPKPEGNVIANNRIRGFHNPTNMNVSCGIRLENSNADMRTSSLVEGNSIDDCGIYGILVENHDGAVVRGNTVRRSERSGLVIGRVQGTWIEGNYFEDCDASDYPNQAAIYLMPNAGLVSARNNQVTDARPGGPPPGFERVHDFSSGANSNVEAAVEWG
ncbi:MAG: right-handed parallel beta-helix repeat-containing protein, partial [Planctomycetota bacterium]